MRKVFFEELEKIMSKNKDVLLLVDDLGFSFIENVQEKFPAQVINCGIIEQAMTGIATGLSLEGKKIYIYGTIPFVIMRNYEQLRNDACYNKNKVIIVGTSHNGFLGFSHNIKENEDVKILKHLPNLNIYLPKTKTQLEKAMLASYNASNSSYIRL